MGANEYHKNLRLEDGLHIPYSFEYANTAAREAATGFTTADEGKLARQLDTNALWMLTDRVTPIWTQVGATDVLVKISATDTVGGLLNDKLTLGEGTNTTNILEKSITNGGSDEDLKIQIDPSKINHSGINDDESTKHREINDSDTSITELWSADKINTELGGKSDTSHNHTDAIHNNVSGEIAAITEKTVPIITDLLLIEDTENGNNKKSIQLGNISLADKNYIDFTPITGPAHKEGRIYYDNNKNALSYYNNESDITLNIGQEIYKKVRNISGYDIEIGKPVFIYGIDSGLPTINLADAVEYNKSRMVGVTTHKIENNTNGYVTRIGQVSGIDTSSFAIGDVVYLDPDNPGGLINTIPLGRFFIVRIGVVEDSAADGTIHVDLGVTEYTAETVIITGWPSSPTAELSFIDIDRKLTIDPIGANISYRFYQYGIKYIKESDFIVIPDVEGLYYIYYNEGILTYTQDPTYSQADTIMKNNPTVAYVYWNATDKRAELFNSELHSITFLPSIHAYLHFTRGAQYLTGLGLTDILANENGDLDSHAQFGVEAGDMVDEDLYSSSPIIGSTVGLGIFYLIGSESNPSLRRTTNAGFSVLTAGSGRLAYNLLSGGTWSLAEVSSTNHVLCHVFATNENAIARKIFAMVGINMYANLSAAEDGASDEISSILTTFEFLSSELVPIATVIFQTNNGYDNLVKGRIREYIDWRVTEIVGGGGTGGTGTIFSDANFKVFDDGDATKEMQFQLSGITTGNNRILTIPDKNLTVGTDDDAIHDNIEAEISIITEKTSIAKDDIFLIEDSADSYNKKKVKKSNLTIFPEISLYSESFKDPASSDWVVNSLAPIGSDATNSALSVRFFDDTTEEGIGFSIKIPTGATSMIFDFVSRAVTAPAASKQVVLKLYRRSIIDNTLIGEWTTGLNMTAIDIPTNAYYQYDTQTISLATLSLTAGNLVQFELTRAPAETLDNLVGDWALLLTKIRFL